MVVTIDRSGHDFPLHERILMHNKGDLLRKFPLSSDEWANRPPLYP